MNSNQVRDISSSQDFQLLSRQRNRSRWVLAFFVVFLHAFFVGGIAFYNEWFGQMITAGGSIPLGIVFTVIVIVLMVLSEAVYIWLGYRKFDPLQSRITARIDDNE
jgi:uncharacterized membrane protein (DUF485 family)